MRIRDAGRPVDIVVVVPARDEEARIAACLRSVGTSLRQAVSAGAVGRVAVAVVGHRCIDDTLGKAAQVLVGLPHVLVADATSTTVGQVRALGVRAALELMPSRAVRYPGSRRHAMSPRETWVLNTDADSVVPGAWVTQVLSAASGGQQAVVGLARLPPPIPSYPSAAHYSSAASTAYRRILRAGIHGRSHDHVYGANLAVRADAYASVGGFPSVPVGEDRALLDALVAHGRPVVRPCDVIVTTSGRRHGRASGGLASLLDWLDRAYGGV